MKKYPLFKVHVDKALALAEIEKVFDSGYINEGEQVTALTKELSKRFVTDDLVLTNSCTSAITLALYLAGVRPGDEVISTPMTCVATNTAIVNAGAKIVWADIDPLDGMIDPRDVARKITAKTKAVIAVAWAGIPPKLDELEELLPSRGVKLILDAAHAFDAEWHGTPIHAYADYTCYSFQAIKHFTTGDGGALICANPDDHRRAKALKWFGLDRDAAKDEKGDWKGQQWDVDIVEAGYKFNMNNVAAAIGLSQLSKIDRLVERHRANAVMYDLHFVMVNSDCIKPLQYSTKARPSFWVYTVVLGEQSGVDRDELLKSLNEEGIMAGVVHVPNDDYTAFKEFKADLPGVRSFSSRQFSLPCGWWLSDSDIEHIFGRLVFHIQRLQSKQVNS